MGHVSHKLSTSFEGALVGGGDPATSPLYVFGPFLKLIVGPAIFALAAPTNMEVSVFTQTMDRLLPAPLPYVGNLVGIAVLLSASTEHLPSLVGTAVAAILTPGADLIMLATQGRGGFDRLMVGSVAERVIQGMPCPVFRAPISAPFQET